jgi:hypothetical protein
MDREYKSPSVAHQMTGFCVQKPPGSRNIDIIKSVMSQGAVKITKKAAWTRELLETLIVARLPQKFANF